MLRRIDRWTAITRARELARSEVIRTFWVPDSGGRRSDMFNSGGAGVITGFPTLLALWGVGAVGAPLSKRAINYMPAKSL
jgi:hypothetical protein